MKVIFLMSALQRFLFCSTFNNISTLGLKKRERSTLKGYEGSYFEKYIHYLKIQNNSALKYYRKHYFKSYTGKCNFEMSQTSIPAGTKG